MRRLLYFALVLVLLALTGLAFVRVMGSQELIARQRFAQVEIGMTRERVEHMMSAIPKMDYWDLTQPDEWRISDKYWLIVEFGPDNLVIDKRLERSPLFSSYLDHFLEAVGYPEATISQRGGSSFEFKRLARKYGWEFNTPGAR